MMQSPSALPPCQHSSKKTINLAFAIMVACIVLLGGYSIYQTQQLNQRTEDIYAHPFIVNNAMREIATHVIVIGGALQNIVSTNNTAARKQSIENIKTHERAALALFDVALKAFLGEKNDLIQTRQQFIDWLENSHAMIDLAEAGQQDKAYALLQDTVLKPVNVLNSSIQQHIEFANKKAMYFHQSAQQLSSHAIRMSIVISVFILCIAGLLFIFISRRYQAHSQDIALYIQNIQRSEEKFRGLLDAAPDAVLLVDQTGKISIANAAVQHVFGYHKDELLGKQINMLIPMPVREAHQLKFDSYFAAPEARCMNEGQRLNAQHKDGHSFPVTISLSPVRLDGITYITCDVRDMTAYMDMEEKFLQAQKMESVGTLVGGIAHDFNNILAAITGSAFLAHRKLGESKHLRHIEQQAERASDMVKQLLAFARKDIIKMEALSLNALVRKSTKLFKMATSEDIQFNINICSDELVIKGDVTQLQQVLMSLVNNARDAVHESSTPVISVSVTKSKTEQACISVSDNGHGIDGDHINDIFEPFFTQKDVGKGTGLGLAMVKGTIESHGGIIDVESIVGEGTTFSFCLPLSEHHPDELVSNIKENDILTIGAGECILLVDDEPVVREVNRAILEELGYRVMEATDGLQAVATFEAEHTHIKLIIMDVVMPRMGGIKAADDIRKISAKVPIIFATGYDRSQVLGKSEQLLDRSKVMTKPFSAHALNRSILDLM